MKMNIYPDFMNKSADKLAEAIKREVEHNRAELDAIRSVPASEATFANTVLAMEHAGKSLGLVSNVFFNLLHCDADDRFMELSEELMPLLSDLSNEYGMDPSLARNIKKVYDNEYETLTDQVDRRLLFRTYEAYRDRGAYLDEEKKEELKRLRKELSMNTLKFGQNVLKEQNAYSLLVTDKEAIRRLPTSALEVARKKAESEGHDEGWAFDFSFPSYTAILKYCDDRSIRKKINIDRGLLAYDPSKETCNIDTVYKIVELRDRIAHLLGHENYATYTLQDRMANSVEKVYGMLDDLYDAYIGPARKEVETISAFAHHHETYPLDDELQAWDWAYYTQLYKNDHLQYDEEATRPFFMLDNVVKAMLGLASDLYDITFRLSHDYKGYNDEVQVYEVTEKSGAEVGIIMMDFFPRKGKRSGAWMTNFVEAYDDVRPVVSLVMNFTPPTKETPSLLTFDETTTLFHEFGHGLHGLLTKVKYESLSGTNVVRDFVELPSQINENWMREPEFVRTFAKHYMSGEVISDEMLQAIQRNALFLEGYLCIRQLNFGYLDMAWHTQKTADRPRDIVAFEQEVGEKTQLLPANGGCISCSFSHIFSGGYASGYYGYKWAEILDADAFEEYKQHGLWNKEVAQRFKVNILERGDAEDANVLYERFKGRPATVDALLHRSFPLAVP